MGIIPKPTVAISGRQRYRNPASAASPRRPHHGLAQGARRLVGDMDRPSSASSPAKAARSGQDARPRPVRSKTCAVQVTQGTKEMRILFAQMLFLVFATGHSPVLAQTAPTADEISSYQGLHAEAAQGSVEGVRRL